MRDGASRISAPATPNQQGIQHAGSACMLETSRPRIGPVAAAQVLAASVQRTVPPSPLTHPTCEREVSTNSPGFSSTRSENGRVGESPASGSGWVLDGGSIPPGSTKVAQPPVAPNRRVGKVLRLPGSRGKRRGHFDGADLVSTASVNGHRRPERRTAVSGAQPKNCQRQLLPGGCQRLIGVDHRRTPARGNRSWGPSRLHRGQCPAGVVEQRRKPTSNAVQP